MSVYVDDAQNKFRNMVMCHMVADTTEELNRMALRLGLRLQYIQKPGTPEEHYDIAKSMRARALKMGAVEITSKELVNIIRRKREDTIRPKGLWTDEGQG